MDNARECFDKPVWTLGNLLRALPDMPRHLVRLLPTLADRVLSNAFRERIMLAVAAANRCRYCKAAHGVLGKLAGMTEDEVRCILEGGDDDRPAGERLALQFARDLAEREFRSRDKALYGRLGEFFSERQRAAIESTAHVMNFANRFGNTFDATLVRLKGGCEETEASWVDLGAASAAFLGAGACVAPVLGAMILAQKLRSAGAASPPRTHHGGTTQH